MAKIPRGIPRRIFAGSFAKKRGFSQMNPVAPPQNPYGFCSVCFCKQTLRNLADENICKTDIFISFRCISGKARLFALLRRGRLLPLRSSRYDEEAADGDGNQLPRQAATGTAGALRKQAGLVNGYRRRSVYATPLRKRS